MGEAEILLATMTDRACITRERWVGSTRTAEAVYTDLPCAVSRTVHAITPRLSGNYGEAAETESRMTLLLPAGTILLAGDRAEIRREGQLLCGICSASLPYPSHSAATLVLEEVTAA